MQELFFKLRELFDEKGMLREGVTMTPSEPKATLHGDNERQADGASVIVRDVKGQSLPQGCTAIVDTAPLQLAVAGQPNVGKSTLVNALMDEHRVITGPEAGLTRDSVRIRWEYNGRQVWLVDTPGWRKRQKIESVQDELSAMDGKKSFRRAHVCALVIDHNSGLTTVDYKLLKYLVDEGRAVLLVINKLDTVSLSTWPKVAADYRTAIENQIPQMEGLNILPMSALTRRGIQALMPTVEELYRLWCMRLSTARLNRWLSRVNAPAIGGSTYSNRGLSRVQYLTQVKARPPTFAAFFKGSKEPESHEIRHLKNMLYLDFGLYGVPIRILTRTRKPVKRKKKGQVYR
mmetsp:Transcript_2789/g.10181  ORF Transcript_2789/g.10181 Transcript_2789/m.10181 type:complete len:346 (-) Transcript_2789:13-1050(-)